MHCVKILLKQSLISKQIISKCRNRTQFLWLVAHIENISIPAYYEQYVKIKYFVQKQPPTGVLRKKCS